MIKCLVITQGQYHFFRKGDIVVPYGTKPYDGGSFELIKYSPRHPTRRDRKWKPNEHSSSLAPYSTRLGDTQTLRRGDFILLEEASHPNM